MKSIFAVPYEIGNVEELATVLAPLINRSAGEVANILSDAQGKNRKFVWLARKIDEEKAQQIRALNLAGVYSLKEIKRAYPYASLGGHLIGFVGMDNVGLAGLEQSFDERLKGESGRVVLEVDAHYRTWDSFYTERKEGASVVTTIDEYLQTKAEILVSAAAEETRAKSAVAIILDPRTGEVLSLAGFPDFDPNFFNSTAPEDMRVTAVQEIYELGSMTSIFTSCMSIEESSKQSPVAAGRTLKSSLDFYSVGEAATLSKELAHSYLVNFGFGMRTGIELPGETSGLLRPAQRWVSSSDPIAITLMQLITAVGAIANSGVRVSPHFVKNIIEPGDSKTVDVTTAEKRSVISPRTANIVTDMLKRRYNQENGPTIHYGENHDIAGYVSQNQKLDPATRTYSKTRLVTIVVGFTSYGDSQYAILVMLDEGISKEQTKKVAIRAFNQIIKAAYGGYTVPSGD